jgi:hypothetical protein
VKSVYKILNHLHIKFHEELMCDAEERPQNIQQHLQVCCLLQGSMIGTVGKIQHWHPQQFTLVFQRFRLFTLDFVAEDQRNIQERDVND